jgi:trimeric autotransporter adhesin
MTLRARLTVFFTCAAAIAAALEAAGRQEGPGTSVRQLAFLKASNAEGADHFACGGSLPGHIGNAIAVSGDGTTVAVGAPHESSGARGINGNQDDNSVYNSGAVYVYVRRGDTWTQQAYIKASNTGGSDMFGLSLSLSRDGNTLAVAAPWEASAATGVNGNQNDDSIPQAGAVYIFTRSGNTWSQHSYIKASNTGRKGVGDDIEGDQFGFSVSLSGNGSTLAVGAISEDSNATGISGVQTDDSAASSGAVYVFRKTGNSWAQEAYLKSGNSEGGDLFGYGVGLSEDGNALAVAGYDEDGSGKGVDPPIDNGGNGTGAIYAFDRRGGAWRQTAYFKGSRSQRNDALGYTVAISGDGNTIAAGTAEESCLNGGINPSGCDVDTFPPDLAAGSAGAVYIWTRRGDTWAEQAFIKASNPDLEDWFAVRIALNGDGGRLFVGAPMEDSAAKSVNGPQDDDSAEDSGAAYLYERTGTTWRQLAYIKASNTESYDEFGTSVAISGDGQTVLAGARMKDEGSGAAYAFTTR